MNPIKTDLPGVTIFEPTVFKDGRGIFFESYRRDILLAQGMDADFVQENVSVSNGHVLRGLHYQLKFPQAKLCRVLSGSVLDIAVDIRTGSPYFGHHVSVHLSSKNFRMLYVPRGFAHGVLALEDNTIFQYKCDNYYSPRDSMGIIWDDPDLNIHWGIKKPILSEVDGNLSMLKDIPTSDLPPFIPSFDAQPEKDTKRCVTSGD